MPGQRTSICLSLGAINGGVKRAKARIERRRVQRWPQERADEFLFGIAVQGQPLQQEPLALDRGGEPRMADPFHVFLMVGRHRRMGDDRGRSGAIIAVR